MEVKAQKHKRFICSFQGCSAAYNKQWKLDAHLCAHTGVRPHTCAHQGCGKSFSSPYHLSRHQLTHSGAKPFPCTEHGCDEAFTTNANRLRHVERFHGAAPEPRPYVCQEDDCGLRFKKNKQLKSHMCERHQKLPSYPCTFQALTCQTYVPERDAVRGCTMRFSFPSKLKRHEKVHKGYPCSEEGCVFSGRTWTELTAHRREHHRASFSCAECTRTFKDQCGLKQHQRVHSDTRLVLKCPRGDCDRTFTTPFNLQSHIQSFHEELRPFTCPQPGCGRSFAMKQSLTRHGVVHDPERKKLREAPNKRSLASRLSGVKDPKKTSPGTRPGLHPAPVLCPSPNPPAVQTPVRPQDQELTLVPNNGLKPDPDSVQSPGLLQSPVHGPSPGLVQDSAALVSLLQDTCLQREPRCATVSA